MAEVVPIARHAEYERLTRASVASALAGARQAKLKEIFIVGIDQRGELYLAGSPPDPGNAMWLMASATNKIISP